MPQLMQPAIKEIPMIYKPTPKEIVELMRDGNNCRYNDEADHVEFARAVLAKWGTPAHVGAEPVAWAATSEDGDVEALGMNQSRRFDTPLYTHPSPPEGMAGWMPIETAQWFTVVYHGISTSDEARALGEHPKAAAISWSNAIRERDAAQAAHKEPVALQLADRLDLYATGDEHQRDTEAAAGAHPMVCNPDQSLHQCDSYE